MRNEALGPSAERRNMKRTALNNAVGGLRASGSLGLPAALMPLGQFHEFDLTQHPELELQSPAAALVALIAVLIMAIGSVIVIWRADKKRADTQQRQQAAGSRPNRSESRNRTRATPSVHSR